MRQEPRAARAGPDGRYVDLVKACHMLTMLLEIAVPWTHRLSFN